MSETILLIDGMYLVFSSFYSNRNMRTLQGDPTGATYGFITRTENLLRDLSPQRIGVAFDVREKTFRHNMYAEYKAKRLAPPEELIAQLPDIKEYLRARGIPIFEAPGFEADDIIAGISLSEAAKGNRVLIFSADKDLFQLVRENIYIFHPKLKQELGAEGVKEHFGVSPERIVDYLSLMGDASDNIPGVPGVGEKTALKLMTDFGTVENLLENIDKVKGKLKDKIKDNLDSLELSRKLVDLGNAPPLTEDISCPVFENKATAELVALYERLSFNSLLKRLQGGAQAAPKSKMDETKLDLNYTIVKDLDALKKLKEKILEKGHFAYDLETTALEFFKADLVGISIAFGDGDGYYIPFIYPDPQGDDITVGLDDFVRELKPLFEDKAVTKTGHNLKFDILHLVKYGIDVKGVKDDSMVMSYLLHPNRRAHSLKELTFELLNYKQVEYDQLVGKGKSAVPIGTVDLEKVGRYCIEDSYLSEQLIGLMDKGIEENGLRNLYETIEIPLVKILCDMEYAGVRVNMDFLKEAAVQLGAKIQGCIKEIYELAGYAFNINSSQQLGELLFEKMNLPVKKRTRKTKSYSTDNEVLSELKDYPVVAKVIVYRSYKKILSTYVEGLMETVDQVSRVHTSYNQTVTATGRLSSSNPNLQNIPVGEAGGVNMRDAFVAEEGNYLLAADYSQVELRVMAHFSEDKNLLEAFANDFDIHKHTADTVFGNDLFSTEKERRKRAKVINFSVLYGSGPFSLSKELGVSYKEAQQFIEMYFEKYTGVKDFMEGVIAGAEQDPVVKTISGRLRHIPEILSSNRTVKENGNRMAINTIIQGSAADIIKIAMLNIHRRLEGMESRLIMQVHDELVFEYPLGEEEQLFEIVKSEMEGAVPLKVPLKVDMKKGKTWGSME